MAIDASPQVVQLNDLPQYDFSGFGQLAALLLDQYRRRGPQLYTSPTGQATQISPAERVAADPDIGASELLRNVVSQTPGASMQPTRLPFLPSPPIDTSQLQQQLGIQQTQQQIAREPLTRQEIEASIMQKKAKASLTENIIQRIKSGELKTLGISEDGDVVDAESPQATSVWEDVTDEKGRRRLGKKISEKEKPKKLSETEAYRQSLQNASEAIQRGLDRRQVREKLLKAFPDKAIQIERDLAFF